MHPTGWALALSLAAVGAGLAQPYLTKQLIDEGLLAGNDRIILEVAGLMVALAFAALFLGAGTRLLYVDTSARILHGLRESLFAHLLTLSPEFFARTRQGDLMVRLDSDIAEMQRFALDLLLSATNNSVLLIGSLLILYQLSPPLTGIMLLLLILNAIFLRALRPRIERLSRNARERGAGIAVAFVATIYGVGAANLILLPIAKKLLANIARLVAMREMFVDGLVGIANGDNPRIIESRMQGYIV